MEGYVANIEKKSLENKYFREVLFTGPHSQLVVMSIAPGEDIGMETHNNVDQFFRIEAGIGRAVLNGKEYDLTRTKLRPLPMRRSTIIRALPSKNSPFLSAQLN
jgi:mannose-6-phosphate isomerase-like protein (cupin superfamily)